MTDEKPLWSILIATLASREAKLKNLLGNLLPQAERAACVEVVGLHNNGEWPLGKIRQRLLTSAQGSYTSYLDDDDDTTPDFVEEVVSALKSNPDVDVVGFNSSYWEDQNFMAFSLHSLQFEPHDTPGYLFRDLTHQMVVRSDLARQGDFTLTWPEDNCWRNTVRPLLKTEVYLDKVLYIYKHSWSDSVQGQLAPHTYTPRPEINSPVFRRLDMPGRDNG